MNKNTKIFVFVSFVSILFLYTFNYTSSRYLGQVDADKNVVAVPILDLSNNGTSYELKNILPGYEETKEFEVSNTIDAQVNEILLSYYFQVTIDSEIPLNVKLYNEQGEEIPITEGKTEEEQMEEGIEVTKKYKITISWDKSKNSYEYAGLPASVKVDLIATQVVEGS